MGMKKSRLCLVLIGISTVFGFSSGNLQHLANSGADPLGLPSGGGAGAATKRCERISIPMCKNMKYNLTRMPNDFGHETQEEAGLEAHQFWPLTKIHCSPYLTFFLCSMYTPICFENYDRPVPPCRSVCEKARDGCVPVMKSYGFPWPDILDCNKLPENGKDPELLCMEPKFEELDPEGPPAVVKNPKIQMPENEFEDENEKENEEKEEKKLKIKEKFDPLIKIDLPADGFCNCECREPFLKVPSDYFVHRTLSLGNSSNCANPCRSAYFQDKSEQNFTKFWIGLWAIFCFFSTFVTLSTFLIDSNRFRYPERSIIFLSFSYFMVSIGFLIRIIAGHEDVACDSKHGIVRSGTTDSPLCTIVFLLVYLFGMSSSLWWVMLTFTWFLSAGLKWSNEAITKYSQYFHVIAWSIPSVKSVAILAISAVDGDPVAGICSVGNTDTGMLLGFVIAPLCAYLLIGSFFLFAGFVSLFRIRKVVKSGKGAGAAHIEKLEQLMVRIGIFSVLYTVPATIVIACFFYEFHYRKIWEISITCAHCIRGGYRPDFAIFMLKYLMCLVVGITSGVWIWSRKTLDSWANFFRRIFCCCCPPQHPVYQPAEAIIVAKSHTDVSGSAVLYSMKHQHQNGGYPYSNV